MTKLFLSIIDTFKFKIYKLKLNYCDEDLTTESHQIININFSCIYFLNILIHLVMMSFFMVLKQLQST